MQALLQFGYTPRVRPSGHDISAKFQRDNGGAIPPNLIALANTESNGTYQKFCRENDLPEHPARFPSGLPAFFVKMLTDPQDLVVDPFAGSCMTGAVAESMKRRWLCYEIDPQYLEGAKGRFASGVDNRPTGRGEKPYEVFAPNVDSSRDGELPLIADGGKQRPQSKKRG